MIRILVADDHPIVRRGLVEMLREYPDVRVVAEAATSEEVLALADPAACDVVILDLALPGIGGVEVLKRIAARMPVLVLSVYPENELAIRMLRLGAAGYLTKGAEADTLVAAVRKVAHGGRFVSEAVNDQLLGTVGPRGLKAPLDVLSDREHQVLRLMASGKTMSEIATELSLSIKTVSTYRARLLEKLNLRSTAELIRYALTHKLVD